jgi:hypothetical protein
MSNSGILNPQILLPPARVRHTNAPAVVNHGFSF